VYGIPGTRDNARGRNSRHRAARKPDACSSPHRAASGSGCEKRSINRALAGSLPGATSDLIQEGGRMLREAEKELFSYYRSVCSEYRSRLGITRPDDDKVPLISTTKELSELLEPEALYFRYAHPNPTFGLLFKSTWEEEHGVAVKFENGKVSKVGFQDIVL
jgi:hypothetical protein